MTKGVLASLALVLLAGCAADVRREAASLQPPSEPRNTIQVDRDAVIHLPSGYSRTVHAGSVWREAGTLNGQVAYKATGGIFTIEGAHVHEAYLLLDGNSIAGFYLPGEKAVSWLKDKVDLKYH
jgi:hypothetical protein